MISACGMGNEVPKEIVKYMIFLKIQSLCYGYSGACLPTIERGVDILDCEEISRKVSDLLDEADPIEGSYTLEVGSAGAERALKRPSDFQQFLGSPVLVKLYRAREGRKEFAGYLKGYDEATGDVTVTVGSQDLVFPKKETALIRLRVEF